MNRPNPLTIYPDIDLKLGIKSSFPNIRSALAMIIFLWVVSDSPGELEYSVQDKDQIILTNDLSEKIISMIDTFEIISIDKDNLLSNLNANPIFTAQIESLIVAFELIWRLAKVEFLDSSKPYSAERTGRVRYPKKLIYTINIDIINSLIETDRELYLGVLLYWLGIEKDYSQQDNYANRLKQAEKNLIELITVLSEPAVFKLVDNNKDIIFNLDSIYRKILDANGPIDINGDEEPKGSLRILKSLLKDNLNSFLEYSNNVVDIVPNKDIDLQKYESRVRCFLRLSSNNINTSYSNQSNVESAISSKLDEPIHIDNNISRQRIFFGAPGTGKSYALKLEAETLVSNNDEQIERITFHPDYTYANFVGSYKPIMKTSKLDGLDEDTKNVISVLLDETKTTQEKYDTLVETFQNNNDLTRLPALLGLYFDDEFTTIKQDGTQAANNNSVERNHGRALRKYVQLLSKDSYKEKISYEYVPGPFMRLLVKALKNPHKPYVLIVEEINRANVAAVFGDIFQLLDRNDNGESEYSITTSDDMRHYLKSQLVGKYDVNTIKIPSNMFVWATMNSADQGVYPMDTAFKRRWEFSYYGLDDGEDKLSDLGLRPRFKVGKSDKLISWNGLRKAINDELSTESYNINEDKLMGPFFLKESALQDNDSFNKTFKNKVLMYLFDDVVKQKRRLFFKCETSSRYSSICSAFDEVGIEIFPEGVVNSKWLKNTEETITENSESKVVEV